MTESPHAAQSPEFLSRLHDGELSGAERSAFDAHASSCDACRSAVAEFEASLAAFRSAPTSPAAADLSARILRKIRAQTPSRRPFGVTFGIDLRWAGLAIAALLAVIVATPLIVRRQAQARMPLSAPQHTPAPLSVYLADRELAQSEPVAAEAPPVQPEVPKSQPAPARQKAEASTRAAAPAPQPPAAGRVSADELGSAVAPAKLAASAGGETDPGAREVAAAREDKVAVVRLTVKPLDGLGEPPAVDHAPSDPSLSSLRGTEYVVLVEADGHVREVAPSHPASQALAKTKDAAANSAVVAEPASPFHDLRFAPGDRPRRLLVRVE